MERITRRELVLQANEAETRSQLAAFLQSVRQIIKAKLLTPSDIDWVLDEVAMVKRIIPSK